MSLLSPSSRPRSAAPTDERAYLSRAEVADLFNVSPNTITRWADAGKLHYVRTLGGHRRYAKETVVALVHSQLLDLDPDRSPYPNEEEERVKRIILEIPNLYGDHQIAPIQHLLAARPGLESVWISPARHQVHVEFAPEQVDAAQIRAWLAAGGYLAADSPAPALEYAGKDLGWDRTAVRMTQTRQAGA